MKDSYSRSTAADSTSADAYGTQPGSYDDSYDYGYVYTGEDQAGTGERVRGGAKRAKRGLERLLDEQPLAVGVLALFIGALVALLLPKTRREQALMGEQSAHLVAHAKEVAGKTFQSVKETASSELKGLKEEVVGGLREEAKEIASHATEAAKKTAQEAKETAKREASQNRSNQNR